MAIDTGHTRQKPGATSARGVVEWRFNAVLTAKVAASLKSKGIPAVLLNADGDPISLQDRTRQAKEAGATLFISIHHDSVQPRYLSAWEWEGGKHLYSDMFHGYGLFVSALNPAFDESMAVATRLGDVLLADGLRPSLHHAESIAGENRPLLDASRGIYRFDDLIVLKTASMPAVLIEAGVIVNRDEELQVMTPDYQAKIVDAVLNAATDHCTRISASATITEQNEHE
ncbi:MAG TPA: N-acetylmuramoyl-L-alanine amidase [Methylophilaceae bacterium]